MIMKRILFVIYFIMIVFGAYSQKMSTEEVSPEYKIMLSLFETTIGQPASGKTYLFPSSRALQLRMNEDDYQILINSKDKKKLEQFFLLHSLTTSIDVEDLNSRPKEGAFLLFNTSAGSSVFLTRSLGQLMFTDKKTFETPVVKTFKYNGINIFFIEGPLF